MRKVWNWWQGLSSGARASCTVSLTIVGLVSTFMSVLGLTLKDYVPDIRLAIVIIAVAYGLVWCIVYAVICRLFRDSVSLVVRSTPVTVKVGDIFGAEGLKVIGCDDRFDTRADNVVIAKNSLQGQLILEHGSSAEIRAAVEAEATRRGIKLDVDGGYHFPVGTVIRYESSVDGQTYLLVAASELNDRYEARTNMAEFERMLMKMWREIDTVYALNPVVLPLLGAGIMRFDDGPMEEGALLRCLLCTLNTSGVTLKTDVTVMLHNRTENTSLFEYRDMFRSSSGAGR